MKKCFLPLLCLVLGLAACTHKSDSIIGEWEADKVNLQFDERLGTPEMVKQIGKIEKQNRITINSDSTLVFSTLTESYAFKLTLDDTGNLYTDGQWFGQWKDGQIITVTPSFTGDIEIIYKKK